MINWPSDEEVIHLAEPIIKLYEGLSLTPYICPAGKPTIGWGTTRYPSGVPVTMEDKPVTEAAAEILLVYAERRVIKSIINSDAITRSPTEHQMAAFLSLAYNIGVGAHDGIKGDFADSSILSCFNAGDLKGAANHFADWNKAHVKGKLTVLPGLTRRRAVEAALFLTQDQPL